MHKRGGTVVFECPDHLVPLFGRPWPESIDSCRTTVRCPRSTCTCRCSPLPGDFRHHADVDPRRCPLPRRGAGPCRTLGARTANRRSPAFASASSGEVIRSTRAIGTVGAVACFEPLARVGGSRHFSLQMGPGPEEIDLLGGRMAIIEFGRRFDSFVDTAAIMKNLDLVVTADTAHRPPGRGAGRAGLGRPDVRAGLALAARSAKIGPGIQRCGFFGKRRGAIGRASSSAWPRDSLGS